MVAHLVVAGARLSRGLNRAADWYVTAPSRHEHWCRPARPTGRPVVDAALRGRAWLFG
jgi:hypothetical protein